MRAAASLRRERVFVRLRPTRPRPDDTGNAVVRFVPDADHRGPPFTALGRYPCRRRPIRCSSSGQLLFWRLAGLFAGLPPRSKVFFASMWDGPGTAWARSWRAWLGAFLACLASCACPSTHRRVASLTEAIRSLQQRHAPDPHLAVFAVGAERAGRCVVMTGFVQTAAAKLDALAAAQQTGLRVVDRIEVLPGHELGTVTRGLVCVSVANGREQPHNAAELGTQVLMGHPVRVWKRVGIWYLVQTADDYVCWMEEGSFTGCTPEALDAWRAGTLLIVTAVEECVREQPRADAWPVSDVVLGCLLKLGEQRGDWYAVALPDGRSGFLPKTAAEDFATWKASRRPTPENIERTARSLLGRPYLWGGNSPRGMDCSGFTKLVFFLNGIELPRNASHQAREGEAVPLDADLSRLRKGDLLFFGRRAHGQQPERITHAGIYLGNKLFIHSSERVRINSLDPGSPLRDEDRIRGLLCARRVLPGG